MLLVKSLSSEAKGTSLNINNGIWKPGVHVNIHHGGKIKLNTVRSMFKLKIAVVHFVFFPYA